MLTVRVKLLGLRDEIRNLSEMSFLKFFDLNRFVIHDDLVFFG